MGRENFLQEKWCLGDQRFKQMPFKCSCRIVSRSVTEIYMEEWGPNQLVANEYGGKSVVRLVLKT